MIRKRAGCRQSISQSEIPSHRFDLEETGLIEARHLTKKYGDHYAVKDLSFHLEKGKIYGLLGPNGAGKSTTMNMVTGYLAPTSGEVRICGHLIQEEPEEARRCMGYLPEIPPLYTDMTVEEYLLTVAQLKKIPKARLREEIDGAMQKVQITDRKNRLIRNLSKGYRQRVGIAQTLLGDPQIIILDEPTVGLDPGQILEIRDLIRSLGKTHTVILSSHILSEIAAVCDEVLIINQGRLIADGGVEELERLAQGENRLNMLVEGEPEVLNRIFSRFSQITSVQIQKAEEETGSCYQVELHMGLSADIRRELFYALAEARCPILEMKKSRSSLEEAFLELVSQEPEKADRPGQKESAPESAKMSEDSRNTDRRDRT